MNWTDKPSHYGDYEVRALTKWLQDHDLESIDYWPDTVGICGINDLDNLMVRHRRVGGATPTTLLIGTFELECLRCVAYQGTTTSGNLIPDSPRHLKGRARQRYLDAPFEIPFFAGLTVYPLKTFSCFRLL